MIEFACIIPNRMNSLYKKLSISNLSFFLKHYDTYLLFLNINGLPFTTAARLKNTKSFDSLKHLDDEVKETAPWL